MKQHNNAVRDAANTDYRTSPTNYRLKDGAVVATKAETLTSNKKFVPAGTLGTVIRARTPKVIHEKGTSLYFANVDVELDGRTERIRVPHGALKILGTRLRSPARITAHRSRCVR
ncbi:hypothetical protein [Noviherbaspirillum malthae]|uniref:hypothetical protein n=1 Tax=Noviherbaspirillum malthae TaxID=1260987 RepID=UPI00188F31EC|nr:hypothetical protein [Noviherbaspirillum malthae]